MSPFIPIAFILLVLFFILLAVSPFITWRKPLQDRTQPVNLKISQPGQVDQGDPGTVSGPDGAGPHRHGLE